MSSSTFQTYRHSGKFGPHGPLLALVAALLAAFPLGYAYAYVVKWIPFVYLNFLATLGYGWLFGCGCGWLMLRARVRNNGVAGFTGVVAGVFAVYFAWNGHIHATFQNAPVMCWPGEMIEAGRQLYAEGSWAIHGGSPLTGIPLAIVWVIEAAIIVGISTIVCLKMVSETPFCETSQCWLDQVRKIDTLAPYTDAAQIAAFKSGDLGPLTQAKPRVPDTVEWTRITLKHSPRCQVFHTVSLQAINVVTDKKGKATVKSRDLTRDLVLPAEMFGLITKFETFTAAEPPPAAGT